MNILYLIDADTAVSWYRCNVPAAELEKRGHQTRIVNSYGQQDLDWCDVMFAERIYQIEVYNAADYLQKRGKLTVFDIDDDYWNIHVTNPAYSAWRDQETRDLLVNMIKRCEVVTTTTKPLANMLRAFNKNVHIVPNCLPDEYWPVKDKTRTEEDLLRIGWAGSPTHFYDLQEVCSLFPQILDKYPNTIVELIGAQPDWMPSHDRLIFSPFVKIREYPDLLNTFDIGLAPIADIKFNESKSDLKIMEYAAVKTVPIASKTIAYQNSITPGITGFLAKNPKNWLKSITTLIENPALRLEIAENARKWSETRMMSQHIDKWEKVFRSNLPIDI